MDNWGGWQDNVEIVLGFVLYTAFAVLVILMVVVVYYNFYLAYLTS